MPTKKKRLNISLPADVEKILALLAERDDVPQATKALHLIKLAIEMDEDELWSKLAEERDTEDAEFVPHEDVWK